MAVNVFVYGTLLSGRSNHHILVEGQAKDGVPAVLADYALYQVTPWYPGIVPKPGRKVLGEVYEVSPKLLTRLDRLEGVNVGLYRREPETVKTNDGRQIEAFVYVWNSGTDGAREVPLKEQPWRKEV